MRRSNIPLPTGVPPGVDSGTGHEVFPDARFLVSETVCAVQTPSAKRHFVTVGGSIPRIALGVIRGRG